MNAEAAARPRGRPRDPGVDEDILRAALDLLTEGGFERLSMEAVASRAGVAKATIYRRFPSKIDLVAAMMHTFAPPLAAPPDTGSVRTDLQAIAATLRESMCSTTDTGRMLPAMVSAAKEHDEVRDAMQRFTAARRKRIDHVVRAAIERGELREGTDAAVVGDMLVGAMLYRAVIRGGKLDKRFTDQVVDGLLDGFGT